MDEEVNEDLIKATIRRVTEARAAQTRAGEAESERSHSDTPLEAPHDAKEDSIEATIRRVAEAKAAQMAEAQPPTDMSAGRRSADEEDPIEATIRRVAQAKAAQIAEASPLADVSAAGHRDDAEDPIEATIRRVAADRAQRDADVLNAEPVGTEPDPVDEAIALAETSVVWGGAGGDVSEPGAASPGDDTSALEAAITIERDTAAEWRAQGGGFRPPRLVEAEPAFAAQTADTDPVSRMQAELHATNARVDALSERVNALVSMLERITGQYESRDAGAPTLLRPAATTPAPSADDDWDDAPQLPRIPMGGPPRPAIIRDPSPMTATAEHLVEPERVEPARLEPRSAPVRLEPERAPQRFSADLSETRSAPPAPEPVQKRGFDLLPKNYRITVEDKRRGVDLVPLHRALLGMDGVKDMSLLSYSNGVAIVSVETTNGIEPDALNKAVSRAMAREVKVEVHNDTTMVVKLAED